MDPKIAKFLKKQHILSLCVSGVGGAGDTDGAGGGRGGADDTSGVGGADTGGESSFVVWTASCFYAFCEDSGHLIIASDPQSRHIKAALKTPQVAINIATQTMQIARIQGVQATGILSEILIDKNGPDGLNKSLKRLYFKRFPIALSSASHLYKIRLEYIKFTDNTLFFGSKTHWHR